MIFDEMLCAAAEKSCIIYTTQAVEGYNAENQHIFSRDFEKKIRKLKRRAEHPIYYKAMRRVASVALAILIVGSAWIAVDAEARAAVVGWVKGIYETYFVYHFEGSPGDDKLPVDYRPTLIPDGYTEFFSDASIDTVTVIYTNEKGEMLEFDYIQNPDETSWFVGTEQMEVKDITVNGIPANLITSTEADTASAVMWISENDTAFCISGFLPIEDLIAVAESVQPMNN